MGLFKREETPSIGGEIKKLDDAAAERNALWEESRQKELENSPEEKRLRRMEGAVRHVHVESFSQEALEQARADLAEAEKGLDVMLEKHRREGSRNMAEHRVAESNSEFWHTKINVTKETIKQLEALRDGKSAKEEVGKS